VAAEDADEDNQCPHHTELWLATVPKVTLPAQLNSHDGPPQEQELNPQPPE